MATSPMREESDDEKLRRHEGFCPGCGQPIFNGYAYHKPFCPFMKNDYDTPDEQGYGWW